MCIIVLFLILSKSNIIYYKIYKKLQSSPIAIPIIIKYVSIFLLVVLILNSNKIIIHL
jgi:hypothetical protein